jgi:two-component system response regulator AlgR
VYVRSVGTNQRGEMVLDYCRWVMVRKRSDAAAPEPVVPALPESVPVADILYLKAELKYVTARTREREHLLDESLTRLEEEFASRFVRVHRNCLVAREAIAGFEKSAAEDGETHWSVLVAGLEEKLPVSRRQWPAVKAAFAGEGKA